MERPIISDNFLHATQPILHDLKQHIISLPKFYILRILGKSKLKQFR